MLRRIFVSVLAMAAVAGKVQAQNYRTAIGLRLSSNDAVVNNSISVKHFVNPVVALKGLISFQPAAVGVLAEVHQPVSPAPGLRWLFGGGVFVHFDHGPRGGLQGVIGLDYKFVNVPLNLAVDWKPEFVLADDTFFEPAVVGFTARFTFSSNPFKKDQATAPKNR